MPTLYPLLCVATVREHTEVIIIRFMRTFLTLQSIRPFGGMLVPVALPVSIGIKAFGLDKAGLELCQNESHHDNKAHVPSCRHRREFSSEIQLDSGNKRIISCFGDGSWQAGLSWHCGPERLNVHSCVAAVSQERAFGDQAIQDAMQVPQGSGLAWEFTRHHAPL